MSDSFEGYPVWICRDCGYKYCNKSPGIATWHFDTCDVCKTKNIEVTEPRDFGYLKVWPLDHG